MVDKRLAFVLMPFGEDFDVVYEKFIKPLFEGAGLDVHRADEIENNQNILRDVVEGIYRSDLIIADLTNNNPNVFYELGLAHALRKPVILITQSIAATPFDLKPYRLLEYSTHFAKIEDAKTKLAQYANGFLSGTSRFGSPVTDFLPETTGQGLTTGDLTPAVISTIKSDFGDHLSIVTNNYTRIGGVVRRISNGINEMRESVVSAKEQIDQITADGDSSALTVARNICKRLAERIAQFTLLLKEANSEYDEILQETEDSLEIVVALQREQELTNTPTIADHFASLRKLQSMTVQGRDLSLVFANALDNLPRFERHLSLEAARASDQIRVLASNIDRTSASIARALRD